MGKDSLVKDIFKNTNYYEYLVQYQGDIMEEMKSYPQYKVIIINDRYAILAIPKNDINVIDEAIKFKTIVYIKPPEMFTLLETSPLEAAQAEFVQNDEALKVRGNGVDVAIIDTGIDYLNEEFIDKNGKTKVSLIWDQSIDGDGNDSGVEVPFGSIFSRDRIDQAIHANSLGGDPLSIVPSVDETGHGTKMAGIIAAEGKNNNLKGIVPDSNLVVIKLIEDYAYKNSFGSEVPVFNISMIIASLEFLYKYAVKASRPMVIYMPLGSSLGNHKGNGILEQFINLISLTTKIVVVSGTGNEQQSGGHASGILSEDEKDKVINLDVAENEKFLWLEIWTDVPNIVSVDVISPSGESSGIMNTVINKTSYYNYIFEGTRMKVNYYIPEDISGDELIRLRFYDLKPGIWSLRIKGEEIFNGRFDIWMPQKGITKKGTRFNPDDIYATITNPGNAEITVTAAAYNQNNNTRVSYSGMSFSNRNIIDVAAGGVGALTTAPKGGSAVVSGTSVSAAITAGACAMLLEWGVVQGNYPNMYAMTIKTYLKRGVIKRSGDIYPNSYWGYGILNIYDLFNNIN